MNLRPLLKASLMLGLVVTGRYARDVERTNPGRSFNEILRTTTVATPGAAPAVRPQAVLSTPRAPALVPRPQTASFSEAD